MVDARLKDGSRVNIVFPPLALDGPTSRSASSPASRIDFAKLVEFGSTDRAGRASCWRSPRVRGSTSSFPAAPAPARRRC